MKLAERLLTSVLVLLLGACGGGGGTTSPGGGTPDPSTAPAAATFQFGPKLRKDQAVLLVPPVFSNAARLLNTGQFAVDLTHRFVQAGSPLAVTANCAFTGTIALQLEDRDGNGRASAGDLITATLNECGLPVLARTVSGKVRVEVLAVDAAAGPSVTARLSIVDELKLSFLQEMTPVLFDLDASLRGSLKVEWSGSPAGSRLRVSSSEADDWTSIAMRNAVPVTEALRKIDIVKTASAQNASVESSVAFLLDTGALGGVIQVSSETPFAGDLDAYPRKFVLNAGLATHVLKLERNGGALGYQGLASLRNRTTGEVELQATFSPDTTALTGDVRIGPWNHSTGDQGDGYRVFTPWQSRLWEDRIDNACAQSTEAGVRTAYKADALFQRPVVPTPGLTEAGAVVRLQFGRTIADSNPALQFRFVDTSSVPDRQMPAWNVSATAERLGATYSIRPSEPLRMGREYALEASTDGSSWGRPIEIRDAAGQLVMSAPSGTLAQIYTHRPVVAGMDGSDYYAADASAPAQLRSSSQVQAGLSIERYQWEQLSGPPLHLSHPQSAETLAYLDGDGLQDISPALLQLTVTDSKGHVDRARIRILAGKLRTQGAALVTKFGFDGGASSKRGYAGEGVMMVGAQGMVSPRLVDSSDGLNHGTFAFAVPVGMPLAPGYYEAVRSLSPGSLPVLLSDAFCDTDGAQPVGGFTIREIAFDAQGGISRLAVDFRQQCNAGLHEYQSGSYRFNSAVPLTP